MGGGEGAAASGVASDLLPPPGPVALPPPTLAANESLTALLKHPKAVNTDTRIQSTSSTFSMYFCTKRSMEPVFSVAVDTPNTNGCRFGSDRSEAAMLAMAARRRTRRERAGDQYTDIFATWAGGSAAQYVPSM